MKERGGYSAGDRTAGELSVPPSSVSAFLTAKRVRPFLPYEIPLGDGESARLVLPVDMTAEEAERICGVIKSLAFGPPGPGVVTDT